MSGRNAPRSQTGCSTCRHRKVKCDEKRPFCMRCQGSQVRCEWLRAARRPRARVASSKTLGYGPPRQTRFATLLPRGPIAPANPLFLSDQDREYLAFFPHTSLVHWLGKPWKWASLNYIHSKIAPYSPVVMNMTLAIAATELEGIRFTTHRGFQQRGQLWEAGASHYQSALRGFQCLLRKPQPVSQWQITEVIIALFLMIFYEHFFRSDTVGLVIHLRGIYVFLRSCGVTFHPTSQQLPELTQQMLLLVMYIHLSVTHMDQITPRLWEEAGLGREISTILDQLFHASRNAYLAIWQSDYPTEQLIDDVSVFRPLQLFNECHKVKSRLILRKQELLVHVDASEIAQQLASIGNQFRDLIAVSQRSVSSPSSREVQAIYLAVVEYHATNLLLHQLSCAIGDLSCHRTSLKAAIELLKKISRDNDSTLGRFHWSITVVAKSVSDPDDCRWVHEALTRTHRMGLFKVVARWNRGLQG